MYLSFVLQKSSLPLCLIKSYISSGSASLLSQAVAVVLVINAASRAELSFVEAAKFLNLFSRMSRPQL